MACSIDTDYRNFDCRNEAAVAEGYDVRYKSGTSKRPPFLREQSSFQPRSVLKHIFNEADEELWKQDLSQQHSFVYVMLHPRSREWQSEVFKMFITTVIGLDLLVFILSTEPQLQYKYHGWFLAAEGVTSSIFLAEYVARWITATENIRFRDLGPVWGRLRYMVTFSAIIDAVATAPFFLNILVGWSIPTLTYLRVFRVLRILKTDGYARAFSACYRVVYYNREILSVATLVCCFLVMLTSVLLYYLRPPNQSSPEFRSIPSTIFLSILMLTGQDTWIKTSESMPWYTKIVVGFTGALSVAMFAIPVSLLTWGFEAEAERCAKKARNLKRKQSTISDQAASNAVVDECNSDEEYQKIIAGEHSGDESDNEKRTSQMKTLIETFLKDDLNGRRFKQLSEFLVNSNQPPCDGSLVSHEIELEDSSDIRLRLQSLESTVESMNSTLERISRVLEAPVEQNGRIIV